MENWKTDLFQSGNILYAAELNKILEGLNSLDTDKQQIWNILKGNDITTTSELENSLLTKINNLNSNFTSLDNRTTTLSETVNEIIEGSEDSDSEIATGIAGLNTEVNNIKTTIGNKSNDDNSNNSLYARIYNLQTSLNILKDDLFLSYTLNNDRTTATITLNGISGFGFLTDDAKNLWITIPLSKRIPSIFTSSNISLNAANTTVKIRTIGWQTSNSHPYGGYLLGDKDTYVSLDNDSSIEKDIRIVGTGNLYLHLRKETVFSKITTSSGEIESLNNVPVAVEFSALSCSCPVETMEAIISS